jgi:hypothetical protein
MMYVDVVRMFVLKYGNKRMFYIYVQNVCSYLIGQECVDTCSLSAYMACMGLRVRVSAYLMRIKMGPYAV